MKICYVATHFCHVTHHVNFSGSNVELGVETLSLLGSSSNLVILFTSILAVDHNGADLILYTSGTRFTLTLSTCADCHREIVEKFEESSL